MGEVGLNIERLFTEILGTRSVDFKNSPPTLWCSKNCEIFLLDGLGCPLHYTFGITGIGLELLFLLKTVRAGVATDNLYILRILA